MSHARFNDVARSDVINLTITRVNSEGEWGVLERWVHGRHVVRAFHGTPEGNDLTFGRVHLKVYGGKMTGADNAGEMGHDIELIK